MKFIFTMFLFTICFLNNVYARDMTWINPINPTGSFGLYSREITNELNKNKFNFEIKTTSYNCALAKHIWNSSQGPTIIISAMDSDVGISHQTNSECFIKATKENFLYFITEGVTSFCSATNKNWNDFIKSNSNHSVIIPADKEFEKFIINMSKIYNNNVKTIMIKNYNDFLIMLKSGEVDFVLRPSIHLVPELQNKCYWNHLNAELIVPELNNFKNIYNKFGERTFLMQKNLNAEEIEKVRNIIKNTMSNNPEIKKQIERRGNMIIDWNTKDQFDSIIEKFLNAQ